MTGSCNKKTAFFAVLAGAWLSGHLPAPALRADAKPAVVLVSIDGYRHDYTGLHRPEWLARFHKEGAHGPLIPVYPSKTFPNHVSIVTGCYPARHGILGNKFYDPLRARSFDAFSNDSRDGSWYNCDPLWITLEASGTKTANIFWVGSEAAISGRRPSYFLPYESSLSPEKRADLSMSWLSLPKEQRPAFTALYFSQVDEAGHRYGPESAETGKAVRLVDNALARVDSEAGKRGLELTWVIVSDHGMIDVDSAKKICVKPVLEGAPVRVAYGGAQAYLYWEKPARGHDSVAETVGRLNRTPGLRAWARADTPVRYRLRDSPLTGDALVETDPPHVISECGLTSLIPAATHGFDPGRHHSMRGIFYARGPKIKKGPLPPFINIHIAPWILALFELRPSRTIDGSADFLRDLLN